MHSVEQSSWLPVIERACCNRIWRRFGNRSDVGPPGNPGSRHTDALSVEAQNASVEEILVALSNAFDVEFRSSADLESGLPEPIEDLSSRL